MATTNHSNKVLSFELFTPEASFALADAYMVVMPGSEGEFGVMAGHVALLATLVSGMIIVYNNKMQVTIRYSIAAGFVEVTEKSVVVFVEHATEV